MSEGVGAPDAHLTVLCAGTAPPHFYKRVTLQLLFTEGYKDITFATVTIPSLQKLLAARQWVVRRKGDMDWVPPDLVQLEDAMHLEAMRLEDEVPFASQVTILCHQDQLSSCDSIDPHADRLHCVVMHFADARAARLAGPYCQGH